MFSNRKSVFALFLIDDKKLELFIILRAEDALKPNYVTMICNLEISLPTMWLREKGDTSITLILEIPETITQAMRLPPQQQKRQVLIELGLSLYAQGILSLGKARELSTLEKREFIELLGERQITRHYAAEDLEEDIAYAGRQ